MSVGPCHTSITYIFFSRYLARFKHAIRNRPELRDFVEGLFSWFSRWAAAVKKILPAFCDPIVSSNTQIRKLTLAELEKDVSRLRLITDREHGHTEKLRRCVAHATITAGQMQQALISHLTHTYDPPCMTEGYLVTTMISLT